MGRGRRDPRYEIDGDVYVADARYEDPEAFVQQANKAGNSIFAFMYDQVKSWWEAGERADLVVTAEQLFDAVHHPEHGRLTRACYELSW